MGENGPHTPQAYSISDLQTLESKLYREASLSAAQFGRSVPWTVTEGPRTATKWRNCFFFNVFYNFTFETAQFAKRDQLKQISKKRPTIRYGVRGCHSDLNAPSLPHSGVWSALFTQASETQE